MATMDDNTALLAAMYQDDATGAEPPVEGSAMGFARAREIRVGVIKYEVPTIEYVARLEQSLLHQQRTIEQQQRAIARLQAMLTNTRSFVRHQSNRFREMEDDLDNKMSLHEPQHHR